MSRTIRLTRCTVYGIHDFQKYVPSCLNECDDHISPSDSIPMGVPADIPGIKAIHHVRQMTSLARLCDLTIVDRVFDRI